MSLKDPVVPSLEDLSHAQVEGSYLFGFTNVSGKVLSLSALGALGVGGVGLAQGFGYASAVAGVALGWPATFGALGASLVAGGVSYWLGNFDDRKIKDHNSRFAREGQRARHARYSQIEVRFIEALNDVEYDPQKQSLPYDALGYAVLFSDDKVKALPPHIQVDVYRTQIDLMVYRYAQVTSLQTVEGVAFEETNLTENCDMERAAIAYRRCRDFVMEGIQKKSLPVTLLHGRSRSHDGETSHVTSDVLGDVVDVAVDVADALLRSSVRVARKPSGGFETGGGGDYGGAGAGGTWGEGSARLAQAKAEAFSQAALRGVMAPMQGSAEQGVGALSDVTRGAGFDFDFADAGGSSGGGVDLGDMIPDDEGAVPVFLAVAAVAAATAAASVSLAAVWKNFVSSSPQPTLKGIHLPFLSRSMATAEKEIRLMHRQPA